MSNAVEAGLYSQLAGGTALVALLGGTAIYNGEAPRGVAKPYVVFSLAAGSEENVTPTRSQRLVYLVKAVAQSLLDAGTIADAIDARLHHATLTVSGQTNFLTVRLTEVRYVEEDPGGRSIGHAGGEYLIRMVGG